MSLLLSATIIGPATADHPNVRPKENAPPLTVCTNNIIILCRTVNDISLNQKTPPEIAEIFYIQMSLLTFSAELLFFNYISLFLTTQVFIKYLTINIII